jgi:hypothetical protein
LLGIRAVFFPLPAFQQLWLKRLQPVKPSSLCSMGGPQAHMHSLAVLARLAVVRRGRVFITIGGLKAHANPLRGR